MAGGVSLWSPECLLVQCFLASRLAQLFPPDSRFRYSTQTARSSEEMGHRWSGLFSDIFLLSLVAKQHEKKAVA